MLIDGDAGKLNTKQKEYLNEVYTGNQRMVALVNALLNVSRLEMGTFTVEPEPTDIIEISKTVIKEMLPMIKKKEIIVKENYASVLPKINIDPKFIRVVFQNLISNAIKYTPEKGIVKIIIELRKKDEAIDGATALFDSLFISVTDKGYGIPKNQQDKIFSKLFRADNVRERDTEGTGLGLYIVKSIIEHSDGKIWFKSKENKGSTFFVLLPLKGMKKKEGTKTLS